MTGLKELATKELNKKAQDKTIKNIKSLFHELRQDDLFSVYSKKELLEQATKIVLTKELNKSLNEIAVTLPYIN